MQWKAQGKSKNLRDLRKSTGIIDTQLMAERKAAMEQGIDDAHGFIPPKPITDYYTEQQEGTPWWRESIWSERTIPIEQTVGGPIPMASWYQVPYGLNDLIQKKAAGLLLPTYPGYSSLDPASAETFMNADPQQQALQRALRR